MHKKLAADLTSIAHSILQLKNKEDVLQTKKWITFIDKTAKEASANGVSALEIFNKGLPKFIKGYKLAKETWYRDLPVLINKYEFD